MPDDKFFMKLALRLAKKGVGKTNPNPMVGAVLVKNDRIIGKGFHKRAGLEHAEINAIREAKEKAEDATLYVNLEPCNHFGKTPPCTKAIIKSGIKQLVCAMKDPNPLNNGKGFNRLKKAGIRVVNGILENDARKLNEVFIKYITKKMPFVIVKVGQSLDGKIATKTGDSKWITTEKSRCYVHRLRSQVDAVMVGVGTVVKDDPLLTSRVKGHPSTALGTGGSRVKGKQPIKIIVDSKLRTPLKSRIFSESSPAKMIIATTNKAPRDKINQFRKIGSEILVLKEKNGKVDLRQLMKELGKREITNVLVEGGGELIGSLVDEKLVDKFLFFISPKVVGGRNAITSVEGKGIERIEKALTLKDLKYKKLDVDLLIEGYPNPTT